MAGKEIGANKGDFSLPEGHQHAGKEMMAFLAWMLLCKQIKKPCQPDDRALKDLQDMLLKTIYPRWFLITLDHRQTLYFLFPEFFFIFPPARAMKSLVVETPQPVGPHRPWAFILFFCLKHIRNK